MAYNPKVRKKYDDKCKFVRIRYSLHDLSEYETLEKYLSDNNISFNSYAKQLIRNDLISKGLLTKSE